MTIRHRLFILASRLFFGYYPAGSTIIAFRWSDNIIFSHLINLFFDFVANYRWLSVLFAVYRPVINDVNLVLDQWGFTQVISRQVKLKRIFCITPKTLNFSSSFISSKCSALISRPIISLIILSLSVSGTYLIVRIEAGFISNSRGSVNSFRYSCFVTFACAKQQDEFPECNMLKRYKRKIKNKGIRRYKNSRVLTPGMIQRRVEMLSRSVRSALDACEVNERSLYARSLLAGR